MRACVAHDLSAALEYKFNSLTEAARYVVQKFSEYGPEFEGGLIAVNAKGEIAMPFNSLGVRAIFLRAIFWCVVCV
jgi:beta-aspartyl-peptidase (threonine type)